MFSLEEVVGAVRRPYGSVEALKDVRPSCPAVPVYQEPRYRRHRGAETLVQSLVLGPEAVKEVVRVQRAVLVAARPEDDIAGTGRVTRKPSTKPG